MWNSKEEKTCGANLLDDLYDMMFKDRKRFL